FPNAAGWTVQENNATPDPTTFAVLAVCASLKGYTVVPGPFRSNRAGDETFLPASCPAPLVPVGGGAFSRSSDRSAHMAATGPNGMDWTSVMNNGSAFDSEAESLAVCAGS